MGLTYSTGIFSYVNHYIYHNIFQFISPKDTLHQNFTLIDASHLSIQKLSKAIDEIQNKKPTLLIADIFHHDDIDKNNLEILIKRYPKIVWIAPKQKSKTQGLRYFDSIKHSVEIFQNKEKKLAFYAFKSLYENDLSFQEKPSGISQFFPNPNPFNPIFMYSYNNYNANPSFAKIYASTLLDKSIIESFIQNKIIILSNIDNDYVRSNQEALFGEKFLHQTHLGFMFKSIIYHQALKTFKPWASFLFLSALLILWIILSSFFSYLYILVAFVLSILFPILSYWIALSIWDFLLPIAQMNFISLLSTLFLLNHWKKIKKTEEEDILSHLKQRLQDKITHQTFYNSDKYWQELIELIDQLLPLKKTILFEKLDNDTRIVEVASAHCSFEEIKELRRDYTREPYASAIKSKSMQHPKRPFFQSKKSHESEFIIPLIHHNEVIGFWAILFEEEALKSIKDINIMIDNLSKEIALLLFTRVEFHQRKTQQSFWKRLVNVEVYDSNIQIFRQNFSIIEKRMLLNETIFDNIFSKIITYSLFGEIIQINQNMSTFFQEEEILAYTLNASDMLCTMTDISPAHAKALVRSVTFSHQEHMQFVHCKKTKRRFLFIASPVTKSDIDNKFSGNYLFHTYGLLFNFIDFEFVEKISDLRQDVITESLIQRKKRLLELDRSLSLLEHIKPSIKTQKHLTLLLKEKVSTMEFAYNQLNILMKKNLNDSEDDQYPLQILKSISLSSTHSKNKYKDKQIHFVIKSPPKLSLTLVSVNSIHKHLEVLFDFLVEDCEENGTISIQVTEEDSEIEIFMHSDGYGMPNEQLMGYLRHGSQKSDHYQALRETIKAIKSWQGEVHFSSELGKGISIFLSLKAVSL